MHTLMNPVNPPRRLPAAALEAFGRDLHRPECVCVAEDGGVYVADWRGGVTRIATDGAQQTWLAVPPDDWLRPNGIQPIAGGAFLIANLGDEGGVWRLDAEGRVTPFVTVVDGEPLPPANFVSADRLGRAWISVSTRHRPRYEAWRSEVADGFIVLADTRGARLVADGLHYTNEVRPDPSGRWLYAIETFARRLVRLPIAPDGGLGAVEIVATFGRGCFPDGFAFDASGGIWVTSVVSNRVFRVDASGRLDLVLEDVDEAYVDAVERAFEAGALTAAHFGPIAGARLQHVSSVAFGGTDARTIILGSLHADCLYRARVEVAGLPPEPVVRPQLAPPVVG